MTYDTVAAHASAQHLRATQVDNALVWDRQTAPHYEVWYLTCNHRASGTGFWIRYTLEAPTAPGHAPYAQLWFAMFDARDPAKNFALNRRVPIAKLNAVEAPFQISIGEAVLRHDGAVGSIAGEGHEARWDLSWLPAARTHYHLPGVIYRTSFADTRVLSPNLDVPVRGTITVDGRTLTFDGEPGGQTHLWGRKHAHAWAWSHCNAFDGRRGAALESLSVRLKKRNVVLPALTLATLYLDGEALEFNAFKDVPWARCEFGTARYRFRLRSLDALVEAEYTCRPEDMILTEYADPDGEPSFCANTEVADLRVTVWRRSRMWRRLKEQARLFAPGRGHFEVGSRAPDPAITRRHVTVS